MSRLKAGLQSWTIILWRFIQGKRNVCFHLPVAKLCSYCGNFDFYSGGYRQTLARKTAVSWATLPSTEAFMIIPGPEPSGYCKRDIEDLLTGTTAIKCLNLSKHLSSDNIISSEVHQVTTSLFSVSHSRQTPEEPGPYFVI